MRHNDHFYCEIDDKHSVQCWCDPLKTPQEDIEGICKTHEIHGDPIGKLSKSI